jgi:homoserine O-acetyltransferase
VPPTGPPPADGGWREGDPVGRRRFAQLPGRLSLEGGGELPGVRIAYETWGTLRPDRGNAVLVLHALTGDSHVAGPAGPGHPTPGWWDGLLGPGRALDPAEVFVVAPNVLGGCQGSTGPASPAPDGRPWGSRWPAVTVRDQVAAELALADALGIDRWALVLGGSMGGMRALEWALTAPDRVHGVFALATGAAATADQIGWAAPQLAAIRGDPAWHGGDYSGTGAAPAVGLAVARRIAHQTYRAAAELEARFGNRAQAGEDPARGGRYAVESYLEHQAHRLTARFDAGSYVALTEAMNGHDVGRGRGGVAAALRRVTADAVVAAIDSDRLYPPALSEQIAAGLGADLHLLTSPHGHDGFLLETEQVGGLVRKHLARLL